MGGIGRLKTKKSVIQKLKAVTSKLVIATISIWRYGKR